MARQLTVIVHGTYAADETWWAPGGGAERVTFADHLERELAARGMTGTVWSVGETPKVAPRTFGWSGANTHAGRVAGAKNLCARLAAIAAECGATEADP